MAVVNEVSTVSHIPQFVPFGLLYYTQDTGDLYIGTGFSTGSDYVGGNPGPNVNVELISSPGGLPGGFNGDIQYNNNGNLGGSAATITAAGAINALSITATSATIGALTATAENIVTSTITSAFVTNETVTTLTATTATITTGNIATLVSPAATITTATITNDHIANAFITTATVTSTLELQTATIVDSLGSTGTVGQALESTGTGVKWAAVSSTETWAALTGAMTATQVAPWYNATSTIDSGISRLGAASLAIGNGTATSTAGSLVMTTATVSSTLYGGVYWSGGVVGLTSASEVPADITLNGGLVTAVTVCDEEFKDDIQPFDKGLSAILGVQPKSWLWKDKHTATRFHGFTAQDVQKTIPEATPARENGSLQFHRDAVLAVAVNAIQELHALIKAQDARIAALEAKS